MQLSGRLAAAHTLSSLVLCLSFGASFSFAALRTSVCACSAGYIVYLVLAAVTALAMFAVYRKGKAKLAYALPRPAAWMPVLQ